jgi:hypothetical protein
MLLVAKRNILNFSVAHENKNSRIAKRNASSISAFSLAILIIITLLFLKKGKEEY